MDPYLQIIHCFPNVLAAPELVCLHDFRAGALEFNYKTCL